MYIYTFIYIYICILYIHIHTYIYNAKVNNIKVQIKIYTCIYCIYIYIYIIYIYNLNFGLSFTVSFSMLFPEAPVSCVFAALYFHLMSSKSVYQIFKVLFRNGNINIFALRYIWLCSLLRKTALSVKSGKG